MPCGRPLPPCRLVSGWQPPRRKALHDLLQEGGFPGELLRFRLWAAAAFVANLVVLGFLSRMVDMAQQPIFVYQVFGAVYALAGALLGLYQMGSYRKPNQWLSLLHRPLHRLRIAGALGGATFAWRAVVEEGKTAEARA